MAVLFALQLFGFSKTSAALPGFPWQEYLTRDCRSIVKLMKKNIKIIVMMSADQAECLLAVWGP
jgi:hypothetical protein